MPDITQPDISEEPRAFTVDEVLAAADLRPDPGIIGVTEDEPGLSELAEDAITGTLMAVEGARQVCEDEIERLVNARLEVNAEIKVRRRQLGMLERMARIVGEPDDDTLDLDD